MALLGPDDVMPQWVTWDSITMPASDKASRVLSTNFGKDLFEFSTVGYCRILPELYSKFPLLNIILVQLRNTREIFFVNVCDYMAAPWETGEKLSAFSIWLIPFLLLGIERIKSRNNAMKES
jgi:hypothetical protein